ncbi:hypothetical protein WL26_23935 [Burkholderia cepacia]|nr:hypothetical protein WL26_23935 [Burkholderia cepacia]
MLVRHPYFRQKTACIQLCQHGCIDLVRLDASLRDQPNLQRIGNRHERDVPTKHVDDGGSVAGCFEHHMIGGAQLLGKTLQFVALQPGAAACMQRAILQVRDLGR